MAPAVPAPVAGLADILRAELDRADYRAEPVTALLDRPEFAVRPLSRAERPQALYRARGETALAIFTRLFLLGAAVERADLARICHASPEPWLESGLLRADGPRVTARFQIVPFGPHRFLTDAPWEYGGKPDSVMPVTNSTAVLRQCLVPSRADNALDLGTGNGVLAVHATRWAQRVIATDISARAIAISTFNAALNGVSVEGRQGRWAEPVAGEQFDHVFCNPPFAIGPRSEILYRDSGEPGDGLSARLVREVAGLLRPGGFAQVLVNWVHPATGDAAERVRSWVAGTGCDAYILRLRTVPPDEYVEWWLPRAEDTSAEELQNRFDEWIGYLEQLGAGAVSYALVTLRARSGEPNWCVVEQSPPRVGDCGPDIDAVFTNRDLMKEGERLLHTHFRVAENVRVEQTAQLTGAGESPAGWWLVRTTGLCRRLAATPLTLSLIRSCQGGRLLTDALRDLKEPQGDGLLTPGIAAVVPTVRELILTGYLVPVETGFADSDLLTSAINVG